MLKQILALYEVIGNNKRRFEDFGLSGDFFIDIYKSQPFQPELYDGFSLPALLVDYSMTGQEKNNPRLLTMNLHIISSEMTGTSNLSPNKEQNMKNIMYSLLIQDILEGTKLGNSTRLEFLDEIKMGNEVYCYYLQTYQLEALLADMIADRIPVMGELETYTIDGSLSLNNPERE